MESRQSLEGRTYSEDRQNHQRKVEDEDQVKVNESFSWLKPNQSSMFRKRVLAEGLNI